MYHHQSMELTTGIQHYPPGTSAAILGIRRVDNRTGSKFLSPYQLFLQIMKPIFAQYCVIPPPDLSGQIIIKPGEVGSGGFGYVYRGVLEDGDCQRFVAVKTFLLDEPVEKLRSRIAREAKVWYSLSHPNILPLLGQCGPDDAFPLPVLISPLCQYGTVVKFLKQNPHVPRTPIVLGIAKGLQYLHMKSIVHGDLKTDNILIKNNGEPVLCDFGRSRMIGEPGFTTVAAASYHFTAPEISMVLDARVTKQADVYSFGVTGLIIITDKRPFFNVPPMAAVQKLIIGHRPRYDDYQCPEMSDKLWSLVNHCWQHEASSRPDVTEVVDLLDQILYNELD